MCFKATTEAHPNWWHLGQPLPPCQRFGVETGESSCHIRSTWSAVKTPRSVAGLLESSRELYGGRQAAGYRGSRNHGANSAGFRKSKSPPRRASRHLQASAIPGQRRDIELDWDQREFLNACVEVPTFQDRIQSQEFAATEMKRAAPLGTGCAPPSKALRAAIVCRLLWSVRVSRTGFRAAGGSSSLLRRGSCKVHAAQDYTDFSTTRKSPPSARKPVRRQGANRPKQSRKRSQPAKLLEQARSAVSMARRVLRRGRSWTGIRS